MNVRRGNESQHHRALKRLMGRALMARGWTVAPEHRHCDLVAFQPESGILIGVEIECSVRNAARNVVRDIRSGCDVVISIAAGRTTPGVLKTTLVRELAETEMRKVTITTIHDVFDMPLFQSIPGGTPRAVLPPGDPVAEKQRAGRGNDQRHATWRVRED